jgi:phosphatidylserine decarboxylase
MARFRLDAAGWPFIAGAFVLALISAAAGGRALAALFIVFGSFFAFFFRDPERRVDTGAGEEVVLSPADGRVLVAGLADRDAGPPGDWQQVSIFLSLMDVHVNRVPVSGRITRVAFTRGRFLPAYRHDAATVNERSEVWIDHHGQTIVTRQIVGILARRVVCRVAPGAEVRAGDHLGVMKFGSRMDVFVPPDATLSVSVGQMVRGGETIIAVLH